MTSKFELISKIEDLLIVSADHKNLFSWYMKAKFVIAMPRLNSDVNPIRIQPLSDLIVMVKIIIVYHFTLILNP